MAEKKRTLWAIDLNGSPLNQFSGNEFEIFEDTDGKINIAVDQKIINAESIENWNEGGGTEVIANPGLKGNETHLASLEIDGTVYDLDGKIYDREGISNSSGVEYQAGSRHASAEFYASGDENIASVFAELTRDRNGGVTKTDINLYSKLDNAEAIIDTYCEIDDETGNPISKIELNADEVSINGQPYSSGTEVIANPTMSGSEPNLTGLQVGNNKYKVPQGGGASLGISDDLVFKTGNLKKNIIAYFSQKYQLNVDDTTDFMLTSRVGDLAEDGGTISVGTSFHYIDVNTAISTGVGGGMTYAYQPTNMSDFELSLSEGEYGSDPVASLSAGSYVFSGTVSSTEVSTQDAFQAIDFTENYYKIDDIISLIFHNSDEPDIIGISWQRNEEYGTETESLSIKEILDCFEAIEEY